MTKLDRTSIARSPLFRELSAEDVDRVLLRARRIRVPKDGQVFSQGQDAHSFFLLVSGHIRVLRLSPDGGQIIAHYIPEGELFGIAVALGKTSYPATAVAAVESVVLSWPNAEWAELQARFPTFGANTMQMVGTRLQETQARVLELSTQQVEQRVASTLLRLIEQAGRKTEAGIEIDFPISRQDIAEMAGTTLHTVSRLLSAWKTEGLVSSKRQKVTVTDAQRLSLIAGNHHDRGRS